MGSERAGGRLVRLGGAYLVDVGYISGLWTTREASQHHINIFELWTVLMAVSAFASNLAHQHVIMYCDNQAVVAWINRWRTGSSSAVPLLRQLYRLLAQNGIVLRMRWLNTHANLLSDLLSRDNVPQFLREYTRAFPCSSSTLSRMLPEPQTRQPWRVPQPKLL